MEKKGEIGMMLKRVYQDYTGEPNPHGSVVVRGPVNPEVMV